MSLCAPTYDLKRSRGVSCPRARSRSVSVASSALPSGAIPYGPPAGHSRAGAVSTSARRSAAAAADGRPLRATARALPTVGYDEGACGQYERYGLVGPPP
ncbi:hypothetical protein EVAR_45276_1 [Eumeta japonica]|uniref:Uncharacterized protein n=1 Tax=Eumeta variegata TaxID=151549 RepID=A0A4C1XBN4_EUMVA|nr:hypothetical protein EVAR_45276_1 [Eumeta japonica]